MSAHGQQRKRQSDTSQASTWSSDLTDNLCQPGRLVHGSTFRHNIHLKER